MDLKRLFGLSASDKNKDKYGKLFDVVSKTMGNLPDNEVRLIAGIAGLLGKVAYADFEIQKEELAQIKVILCEHFGVTMVQGDAIIGLFEDHREALFCVEDYHYIRFVNDVCTAEQKKLLLSALFSVASVDDSVEENETDAIWMIAKSLFISHADFVAEKAKFRDKLSILKS